MCAQYVSFNSHRSCRIETKLSLFLLFISGGKHTKATNGPVLIRKKDREVHPKPQTPLYHTVVYRAEQMKTSLGPGGREAQTKDATLACQHTLTTAHTHTHMLVTKVSDNFKGAWGVPG